MKRVYLILTAMMLVAPIFVAPLDAGSGQSAARFLTIVPGTRPAGMGEAYTAIAAGPVGAFFNPAGLAFLERNEVTALHMEFLASTKYNFLGYAQPVNHRWAVAGSAVFSRIEDAVRTQTQTLQTFHNSDVAVNFSSGYRIFRNFAVGGTVKWVREKLFTFQDSTFSYDLGLMYIFPMNENFRFGASWRNLSGRIGFISETDPLPEIQNYGISYRGGNGRWAAALDFTKEKEDSKFRQNFGVEFWANRFLALRGGFRVNYDGEDKDGFTGGVAVRLEDFEVGYAYVPFSDLGNTHRIDSTFRFGGRTEGEQGRKLIPKEVFKSALKEFRGSANAGYKYTDIDNNLIVNFIPGSSESLELVALGRSFGTDFAMNFTGTYDNWDKWEARSIAVEVRRENIEFDFGDIYARFSPFTLMNRTVRGVRVNYKLIRDPLSQRSPEELHDLEAGGYNLARLYRESGRDRRWFKNIDLTLVAGRTARPVSVGERIPFQNGDFATFGVFEQFAYGVKLHTLPTVSSRVSANLVLVEDDENSIFDAGSSVKPLDNLVGSIEYGYTLPNGRTDISFEVAKSRFDNDVTNSSDLAFRDYATRVSLSHAHKSGRSNLTYEKVNTHFDVAGNLSMRSMQDREGLYWKQNLTLLEKYNLFYQYRRYEDNLDNTEVFTTTTNDFISNLSFRIGENLPYFNGGFNYRTDESGTANDTTATIQVLDITNKYYRVGLTQPFKKSAIGVTYSRTDYEDRNTYSIATTRSSFVNKGWMATFTTSQIKNVNIFLSYNNLKSEYTSSEQKNVFYSGNIDYQFRPGKLRFRGEFNITRNESTTQQEDKDEFGVDVQYYFSSSSSVILGYKYSRDKYTPAEPELDYRADIYKIKFSRVF